MILDNELDMLAERSSTIYGAIGFMTLGAALGDVPALTTALDKSLALWSRTDLSSVVLFTFGVTGGVFGLAISYFQRRNQKTLPQIIRQRGKPGEPGTY